jgi:Membrane proteins related to metalloendopeptidases
MPGGSVRGFEYEIDSDRFLRVGRSPEQELVARVLPIPKTRNVEVVRGQIDHEHTSLVSAIDAAGETSIWRLRSPASSAAKSTSAPNCNRAIASSCRSRSNSATIISSPATVRLPRPSSPTQGATSARCGSRHRTGSPAYFDEHGRSMRRFFLASPLKFQPVVTSAFSKARMHPVLREVRAHLGVDYRAPAGAPVVAVADGVVLSAGMSGGAGRWSTCATRMVSKPNTCTCPRLPSALGRGCGRASSSGELALLALQRDRTSTIA